MKSIFKVLLTMFVFVLMMAVHAKALPSLPDLIFHENCRIEKIEFVDIHEDSVVRTMYFSYDATGNLAEIESEFETGFWNFAFFDEEGKPLKIHFEGAEGDGETFYATATFRHSADGQAESLEWDWERDGIVNEIEYYFYDHRGNLVKTEWFLVEDNKVHEAEYKFYDDAGNLVRVERDWENDGVIDEVEYNFYDADGKLDEIRTDLDADGQINAVGSPTWVCKSANGDEPEDRKKGSSSSGCFVKTLKTSR